MSSPPIPNLRDLAASPAIRAVLRPGVVLRSAAPPAAPSPGLAALGIRAVFDLRSAVEIRHMALPGSVTAPDPAAATAWPGGPPRVHAPVFAETDYGPEAIALRFRQYASADPASGFVAAYRSILQVAGPAFGVVLARLASGRGGQAQEGGPEAEAEGPVLVHCTAGKDRTGVICALLLSLCGVADEDVAAEYGLTEEGLKDLKPRMMVQLTSMASFKDDLEGAERMLSARPESMLRTLKMLREEYGSAEQYIIQQCGISPAGVAAIRRKLLLDPSAAGTG